MMEVTVNAQPLAVNAVHCGKSDTDFKRPSCHSESASFYEMYSSLLQYKIGSRKTHNPLPMSKIFSGRGEYTK